MHIRPDTQQLPGKAFEARGGLYAEEGIKLLQQFYLAGNPAGEEGSSHAVSYCWVVLRSSSDPSTASESVRLGGTCHGVSVPAHYAARCTVGVFLCNIVTRG
jgi:hypothetical protein